MKTTKETKYLNIDQYAEYRGVSRQTIYNWMKEDQDSEGKKLPLEVIAGKKLFKI
jgi:predicted DNA-binding transcriptional regulator AlpA